MAALYRFDVGQVNVGAQLIGAGDFVNMAREMGRDLTSMTVDEIRKRYLSGEPISGQALSRLRRDPRLGVRKLHDLLRQASLRRRYPVLGKDVGDVLVRSDFEVHVQQHAAVAGVGRLHVNEAIDAVDFLLDGSGHRLFDRFSRRARVSGGHANIGRGEKWILFYREPGNGNGSQHDGQDRDDNGDDGPPDEKV